MKLAFFPNREAIDIGELSTRNIKLLWMVKEQAGQRSTLFDSIWNLVGGWLGRCKIFTLIKRGLKFTKKKRETETGSGRGKGMGERVKRD